MVHGRAIKISGMRKGTARYWTNKGPGNKEALLTYEQFIIWSKIQDIEAEAEKQNKTSEDGQLRRTIV